MGNCIEKQRQRELSKRALKREELVRYFLGPSVGSGSGETKGSAGAQELGPTSSRVSTPQLTATPLKVSPVAEALPPTAATSAPYNATSSAALTLVTAAAAAAAAAAADESAASWQLTDRQREAALYAMENDGIERLHDNAELQLEQRRERQRREERLAATSMWEDGGFNRRAGTPTTSYHGGGGGSGLGATGAGASYHGGGARHVSFGNRPTGYRK